MTKLETQCYEKKKTYNYLNAYLDRNLFKEIRVRQVLSLC